MDTRPVWGQICEIDTVMDIEIYYVLNLILETVWLEEKAEGRVSPFVRAVKLYRMSDNMTGTDQDQKQTDSQLLASFCCANRLFPRLYIANYCKCP
jgi:hypothetical protein